MPALRLNAAAYAAPLDGFLRAGDDEIHAALTRPIGVTLTPEQLSAWRLELPVLRTALAEAWPRPPEPGAAPWIHLEFDIPRLGRRVDAVVVTPRCVIPVEFKVGARSFERADYEQAWDYGLDLKNFHAPSHAAAILPILCATEAPDGDRTLKPPHADGVRPPLRASGQGLGRGIRLAVEAAPTRTARRHSTAHRRENGEQRSLARLTRLRNKNGATQ